MLKRKSISLDTKIKILDQLDAGKGSTKVGRMFGLSEATIRGIKKNEAAIRNSVIFGTRFSVKSSSNIRDLTKIKMEKALVKWLKGACKNDVSIGANTIKKKALSIYNELKDDEPTTSSQSHDFCASTGWLKRFFKRHEIQCNNSTEIATESNETNFERPVKIKQIVEEFDNISNEMYSESNEEHIEHPIKVKQIVDEDDDHLAEDIYNEEESEIVAPKKLRIDSDKTARTDRTSNSNKNHVSILICSPGNRILKSIRNKSAFTNDENSEYEEMTEIRLEICDRTANNELNDDRGDDQLSTDIITEGLQMAHKLAYYFLQHDSNVARAEKFQRDLMSCMSCYKELYYKMIRVQTLKTDSINTRCKSESDDPLKSET